jgi:hypothetical protein
MQDFSHLFIVNTILSKLDLEKNFHLLFLGWLIWNYFPLQLVKNKILDWWKGEKKTEKRINSVRYQIHQGHHDIRKRSTHYLSLMDYIKDLPSVHETESVCQSKNGKNVSNYEVCQNEAFLIDKELEIYGKIKHNDVKRGEGSEAISYKTIELVIYSYQITHRKLIEWIEKIHDNWTMKMENNLRNGFLFTWEIEWNQRDHSLYKLRKYNQTSVSFENTFFPNKELLIKELDNFKNGKKEWDKRGQPWQYGVALTGEKGTGKTRILKCISKYMERHLYVISLCDEFPINVLIKIMHGILNEIVLRCEEFILVFEEIADQSDLISKRDEETDPREDKEIKIENKKEIKKRRQFLSKFLPAIDGISERVGGMIIMTTNYVERLDPALIRPGRIDFHLNLKGGYDKKTTFQVIKHWWEDKLENYQISDLKDEIDGKWNGSELIQKCRTLDLEEFKRTFFKN